MSTDDKPSEYEKEPKDHLADLVCERLKTDLGFANDDLAIAKKMLGSGDFRSNTWDSLLGKISRDEKITKSGQ